MQVSRISESALGQVPQEFKLMVRSMLAVEPSVRPDALQITKHAFFEEVAISTLKYLDQLYERGDMEKSQFFKKNLARVMTKLPQVLCINCCVHVCAMLIILFVESCLAMKVFIGKLPDCGTHCRYM